MKTENNKYTWYRNREDNIINFEVMGGWPVHKMNIRDILDAIGAKLKNGKWEISDDAPILDIYPRTLEDDGMGYGVNEKYITEVSPVDENNINMFIYEQLENLDIYKDMNIMPGDTVIDENYNQWVVTYKSRKTDNDILLNCIEVIDNEDGPELGKTKEWISYKKLKKNIPNN